MWKVKQEQAECDNRSQSKIDADANANAADMLTMNQPPLTQHISVPKDMAQLSCEAFTAGIVEGVLDALDVVSAQGCR
jgi:hypothetical protein